MNIIILGSPASGKGTQAERLSKALNLYHLQTGSLARKLAETDARLKEIINSGELIPEEEMSMYVINFITTEIPSFSNILFEGFPRFVSQYTALESFLRTKGDDIDAVISLEVSEEEAVKRISSRRMCSKCGATYNLLTNPPKGDNCDVCGGNLIQRADDNEKSVKVRFENYEANTKELIDFIDKKGKLIRINGERPIDNILNDILTTLKQRHVTA